MESSSAGAGEPAIRVGIGLIGRGGCYLIRRRPPLPGSPMPGVWEFPGGKCEPGEDPAGAAARECREETGLEVVIGRLLLERVHRYPHGLVALYYYEGVTADPAAEPAPATGFRWVAAAELHRYHFPDANAPIVVMLAGESEAAGGPPDRGTA